MEQLLSCLSILNSSLLTLGITGKEQTQTKRKDKRKVERDKRKKRRRKVFVFWVFSFFFLLLFLFSSQLYHKTFSQLLHHVCLDQSCQPWQKCPGPFGMTQEQPLKHPFNITLPHRACDKRRVRGQSRDVHPELEHRPRGEWHVPKPCCNLPAATRSPSSTQQGHPTQQDLRAPPLAQILLCCWVFLVAFPSLQTGN